MRTCLFCDQRASTLEHAWAEWVIELLGSGSFTIDFWFGPDAPKTSWSGTGPRAHVKVKYLCETCNNEWMSDLETAARPIIGPLMSDMALTLDRGQQHVIARWSTKTAMVFECTNPTKDWFYTPVERQDLVAGTLPVGTSIWLGRFDRSNLSFVQAQRLFGSTAATVIGDGYVTTFALARLAIQVLTVRRHAGHRATRVTLDVHSGPWDRALVQIWPPRAIVQWPPALSFSEERLTALCKRFTNPPP